MANGHPCSRRSTYDSAHGRWNLRGRHELRSWPSFPCDQRRRRHTVHYLHMRVQLGNSLTHEDISLLSLTSRFELCPLRQAEQARRFVAADYRSIVPGSAQKLLNKLDLPSLQRRQTPAAPPSRSSTMWLRRWFLFGHTSKTSF